MYYGDDLSDGQLNWSIYSALRTDFNFEESSEALKLSKYMNAYDNWDQFDHIYFKDRFIYNILSIKEYNAS